MYTAAGRASGLGQRLEAARRVLSRSRSETARTSCHPSVSLSLFASLSRSLSLSLSLTATPSPYHQTPLARSPTHTLAHSRSALGAPCPGLSHTPPLPRAPSARARRPRTLARSLAHCSQVMVTFGGRARSMASVIAIHPTAPPLVSPGPVASPPPPACRRGSPAPSARSTVAARRSSSGRRSSAAWRALPPRPCSCRRWSPVVLRRRFSGGGGRRSAPPLRCLAPCRQHQHYAGAPPIPRHRAHSKEHRERASMAKQTPGLRGLLEGRIADQSWRVGWRGGEWCWAPKFAPNFRSKKKSRHSLLCPRPRLSLGQP